MAYLHGSEISIFEAAMQAWQGKDPRSTWNEKAIPYHLGKLFPCMQYRLGICNELMNSWTNMLSSSYFFDAGSWPGNRQVSEILKIDAEWEEEASR